MVVVGEHFFEQQLFERVSEELTVFFESQKRQLAEERNQEQCLIRFSV